MWKTQHDISTTSYIQKMDELTTQYNNLILKAERTNRSLGGEVSKNEATLYFQASKTCEQIMNLNLSQRAVHAKWKALKQECDNKVTEIANILAPAPAKPVAPAPIVSDASAFDDDYFRAPSAPVAPRVTEARAGTPQAEQPADDEKKPDFVTKNACKDVTADTIRRWHKPQPNHSFDNVVGMEDLKNKLINEAANLGWTRVDKALKISAVQSYFFYGPPGTGKTYIIEAFAHELMKKGFHFIQLMGSDIHASLVGVGEKTVQIAFQEAIDNEPCLIFIDEIDNVCVNRDKYAEGHEKRLTVAFLEAYNLLRASGKRVIFMGATNHPMKVDEAMMDRIKRVPVPLPDEVNRLRYFSNFFQAVSLEEGFTFEDMVARTDNYSYRDMERLCEDIAFRLKSLLIQDCKVYNENGELDQDAADLRASEVIDSGSLVLTREMFETSQSRVPPADKTQIRNELREFENRAARLAMED